jgi:hypothetical protein
MRSCRSSRRTLRGFSAPAKPRARRSKSWDTLQSPVGGRDLERNGSAGYPTLDPRRLVRVLQPVSLSPPADLHGPGPEDGRRDGAQAQESNPGPAHSRALLGPRQPNCSYDRSCNLSCPSCRSGPIVENTRRAEPWRSSGSPATTRCWRRGCCTSPAPGTLSEPVLRGRWLQPLRRSDAPRLEVSHLHTNAFASTRTSSSGRSGCGKPCPPRYAR